MVKVRQDAWLKENDELLAEAVIRHVKEGSTQLNAFEEAGDALNRTAAACGFRWNAVVRKIYENELAGAKKERKERMRVFGQTVRRRNTGIYVLPTSGSNESNGVTEQQRSIPLSSLSLDVVIAYLMRLQHMGSGNDSETTRWRHLANVANDKVSRLEAELNKLEKENRHMRKDYEQFAQIMNRARRMITLDEEEEHIAPVFTMERNGNLIVKEPPTN
ncbi:RsfA family transcriptional regulator [Viridibacillus sp. FSL E2-0187]|uniref:RsfA family transcriptional regulator n=1 Tax=Viridibacillus TaxID=496496 RepID=UPI00187BC028|nr:RsfA family transcriptional regulator [Viridibacillus sp. JNUCC-6]QOV10330.1 RsfA family transcriptional regulator [Viridibacillus sp. JNUCC-6]